MINAILKEVELSKDYLRNGTIETIYFGGGTPSLLDSDDIKRIIDQLSRFHSIQSDAEVTLEANPDDLSRHKVEELRKTDISRFSIGIQSFFDEDLLYMNRAHNSNDAHASVKRVQDAGFENITIDLIYGTPTMDDNRWKSNINTTIEMQIPHISCYNLTVEPKTALDSFIRKGKLKQVDEEQSAGQFEILMRKMIDNGFDHYEISNFAKPGYYSRHNSNYWKGIPYLGIGPSAHSYDGTVRRSNIANNAAYIKAIENDQIPFDVENLSADQKYNEYILISMRTIWGTDLLEIQKMGTNYVLHFESKIQQMLERELVCKHEWIFTLTDKGKLMADYIAMEVFIN